MPFHLANSFSNCTISVNTNNCYIGQICGYADGVKSNNVYCSSNQSQGNNGYAIQGIQVSPHYFADNTFISETLCFDTQNIWSCKKDRLTLLKSDINNIYAVYSNGVVTVNGIVKGHSSDIVIVAIKNSDGRLLSIGITACGELNDYDISCNEYPYVVQILVLNSEAFPKPASDDLNILI